jgi:predicted enzyme related to lactoylglutathione lyase
VVAFQSHLPGTPSWVDLSSPDLSGAKAFYGALFGWTATEGSPEAGGYCIFQKHGKNVAGLGPIMDPAQPPAWMTYVSVQDADATMAKVTAAHGTVLVAPMDVLDVGRMAVFTDTTGAALAIWQPRSHIGADLANEPGTFTWNELQTRDTAAATSFYRAVFGWGADTRQDGPMSYTEWKRGDDSVGGMMDMPAEVPPQIPAYWLVYFAVDDCDASVTQATGLGGATLLAPMDVAPGRFAVLSDPTGAVFAVITMNAAG